MPPFREPWTRVRVSAIAQHIKWTLLTPTRRCVEVRLDLEEGADIIIDQTGTAVSRHYLPN